MKAKLAILLQSALIAGGIASAAFFPEIAFINYLADAQSGIAILFSLVAAALIFILCTPLAYGAVVTRGLARKIFIVLLVTLFGFILYSDIGLIQAHRALEEARDPATPAERLVALASFSDSGIRYALDNRLADHPNSPPGLLRTLSERKDQEGTLALVAANPNTPLDVLEKLSLVENEWVQAALKENATWKNHRP